MKNIKICLLGIASICILASGCKKDWLDAKPSKALVVPKTAADYQALLDNSEQMNTNYPSLYMLGDGDFTISDADYNAISQDQRGAYAWADTKDFYGGLQNYDWLEAYAAILNTNVVLDGIKTVKTDQGSQAAYNNVQGSALFYRSLLYYDLAQEFCKPYGKATAAADLGLPLRTSADVNLTVQRSSVQQTFDQIINDLLTAVKLLPVKPLVQMRPSKPAAFGLLSRAYLSQQNYGKALLYADSCLQLKSDLMDFNTLDASSMNPIARFNSEDIFHCMLSNYYVFYYTDLIVDPALYQSYEPNDLRKVIYFIPEGDNFSFRGSYDSDALLYGGIATDEMYLIRAECNARAGNTATALTDLNALLKARWLNGTYTDRTAASADDALSLILTERRKELCYRGLRWTDLRRLNTDTHYQTTLTRTINGQNYSLPPNSPKYVLPIDDYEIRVGGLQQNPR